MVSVLRPGQRILQIPGYGVQTSRRAVGGGNGLLNNLVAYWALDEAAGANNALDKHTNALTLTQVSSPGSSTGKVYSGARMFNGSTQVFTRSNEALLNPGYASLSFAAWCFRDVNFNNKGILAKRNTGGPEYQVSVYSVNAPYYMGMSIQKADNSGGVSIRATETLPVGAWFLVFAWYDHSGGTINIQINNGTVYTNNCGSVGVYSGTNTFRIGSYYDGDAEKWQGRLGPVAMWVGRSLSAVDRAKLWNSGAGLAYAAFTT